MIKSPHLVTSILIVIGGKLLSEVLNRLCWLHRLIDLPGVILVCSYSTLFFETEHSFIMPVFGENYDGK